MNPGDTIYCFKNYTFDNEILFKANNYYTIHAISQNFKIIQVISIQIEPKTPPFWEFYRLDKKSLNKKVVSDLDNIFGDAFFDDYFYTLSQIRKIKLNTIKSDEP